MYQQKKSIFVFLKAKQLNLIKICMTFKYKFKVKNTHLKEQTVHKTRFFFFKNNF